MSVTFTFGRYVEDPRFGTVLMCGADHRHECTSADPCEDNALYGTCDHADAATAACGCEKYDINVSNTNAAALLERLGYPCDAGDELCGQADPGEILGRAMTGNVGRDDQGTPVLVYRQPGHATFIDCGVPAGYFTDRMSAITDLAVEARNRGLLVVWA